MVNAIKPIKINGNWLEGYAMDYHTIKSEHIGYDEFGHSIFDTKRSNLGELLYQIKYKYKDEFVRDIIKLIKPFLSEWDIENKVDIILPVPPSNKSREFQPVFLIAKGIADLLHKKFFTNILEKMKSSQAKNFTSEEKAKEISGSIVKHYNFNRKCNILLIDDLYETGSTLNEVCRVLKRDKNVNNIYVLTITKTRR